VRSIPNGGVPFKSAPNPATPGSSESPGAIAAFASAASSSFDAEGSPQCTIAAASGFNPGAAIAALRVEADAALGEDGATSDGETSTPVADAAADDISNACVLRAIARIFDTNSGHSAIPLPSLCLCFSIARTVDSRERRRRSFCVARGSPPPADAAAAAAAAAVSAPDAMIGARTAAYAGTATSLLSSTKYGASSAVPRSTPRSSSFADASRFAS